MFNCLTEAANQGRVQSVGGTSQQAQRPSVICFATRIDNYTLPTPYSINAKHGKVPSSSLSSVLEDNRTVDLTTPPPACDEAVTRTCIQTTSFPSLSSVNGGKSDNKTSLLLPLSVLEDNRTVDLTTPPPACDEEVTRTYIQTTSSPSSTSVNGGKSDNTITSLLLPSSVLKDNRTVDLTTPPPPCDEAVTRTYIQTTSSPSSSSVNGGKSDNNKISLLLPTIVSDESRNDLTTPPPPFVEAVTMTYIQTTVSPSLNPSTLLLLPLSTSITHKSRPRRRKKYVRTKMNLWRLVRMYRGKRMFCCDQCDFKTQRIMPMWCHLDKHKLRRLKNRKSRIDMKETSQAGLLEVRSGRTEDTKADETELPDSDDQDDDFEGSIEDLRENNFQTTHTRSNEEIGDENLADPCRKRLKNIYQCEPCSYKALTKDEFLKHDEDFHQKPTTYYCSECSFKTDKKRSLIRHCATYMEQIELKQRRKASGKVKLYKCMQCDYKCKFKHSLIAHKRKHTKEKPFHCELCVSKFACKYQMDKHMVDKHSENKLLFNCGQCGYNTAIKSDLVRHERIHSGEKPYHCTECDYRAAKKSHLVIHERIHSGEKPYHCTECDYRAALKIHLVIHERIHSGEKPYHCTECDYRAACKSNLVIHERRHSGEKPYHCSECDYRAARKSHLVIHESTHSGEKPYHCTECDFRAACKSHLVIHERTHSGEKLYHCTECDYRAAIKSNLVIHERRHSGEKPYHCSECDYRAARKSHLVKHERIHSGEKPYHCSECDYRATCKSNFVRHVRKHSGEKPSGNMKRRHAADKK